jgi:hypothetical protein
MQISRWNLDDNSNTHTFTHLNKQSLLLFLLEAQVADSTIILSESTTGIAVKIDGI